MLGSPFPRLTVIRRAIVSGASTRFGRLLAALHESRRRQAAIVRASYRHLNCPPLELEQQEVWPQLARLDRCAGDARRQAARFRAAPRASTAALKLVPSIDSPERQAKGISARVPRAPTLTAFVTEGAAMRTHQAIAVVAAILVGVGVKLIFFTPATAEVDSLSIRSVRVDVSQLHQNARNLPVQRFHDMSVVFPGSD
jgi:hypothetical protein